MVTGWKLDAGLWAKLPHPTRITLDLHGHVLHGMQADAASRVDEALRAALQKRAAKQNG